MPRKRNPAADEADADADAVPFSPNYDPVLIQLSVRNAETGRRVYRTLVTEVASADDAPPLIRTLTLVSSGITGDGDVTLTFSVSSGGREIGPDRLRVRARVALSFRAEANDDEDAAEVVNVVDVAAILPADDLTLIVHGGWIRRAVEEMDGGTLRGSRGGWDVAVTDAVASDPEGGISRRRSPGGSSAHRRRTERGGGR